MAGNKKDTFLNIDGLEMLMNEYRAFLQQGIDNHTIIFYGDTGCGKSMLSNQCKEEIIKMEKEIIYIDLLEHLTETNFDSFEKLKKVIDIIEYELTTEHSGFDDIKDKKIDPDIFKRALNKILAARKSMLLIRFPRIELTEEVQKYYAYLHNSKSILYFITDSKKIADECKKIYDRKIKYFECKRLKEGDGRLYIENRYSNTTPPVFRCEDIEHLMNLKKTDGNELTIKQLKNICEHAFAYAQKKNIEIITKDVILENIYMRSAI